jgi:UDP-N-acetylglucosamine 4,6-dehydratase
MELGRTLSEVFSEDVSVMVTGGTGSFGNAIVKFLLNNTPVGRIVIFSRDEAKQDAMRELYRNSKLDFRLGDVRRSASIKQAIYGCNIVFHAAALKQVPNCEYFPMEAVLTNIIGTENVKLAAIEEKCAVLLGISTDKACKPINAMGMSKGIMEKVLLSGDSQLTKILCVRYGNVISSRGSVVPLFQERIRKNEPIPITNPEMTRFLLSLEEAAALVVDTVLVGQHKDLFVRKMPAAAIADIVSALSPEGYPTVTIGIRPGEKLHEVLISEHELRHVKDCGEYYVIRQGINTESLTQEYSSYTAQRLTVSEIRSAFIKAGILL